MNSTVEAFCGSVRGDRVDTTQALKLIESKDINATNIQQIEPCLTDLIQLGNDDSVDIFSALKANNIGPPTDWIMSQIIDTTTTPTFLSFLFISYDNQMAHTLKKHPALGAAFLQGLVQVGSPLLLNTLTQLIFGFDTISKWANFDPRALMKAAVASQNPSILRAANKLVPTSDALLLSDIPDTPIKNNLVAALKDVLCEPVIILTEQGVALFYPPASRTNAHQLSMCDYYRNQPECHSRFMHSEKVGPETWKRVIIINKPTKQCLFPDPKCYHTPNNALIFITLSKAKHRIEVYLISNKAYLLDTQIYSAFYLANCRATFSLEGPPTSN